VKKVAIFYDHLEYVCMYITAIWYILRPLGNLVAIWYIFPRIGILNKENSVRTTAPIYIQKQCIVKEQPPSDLCISIALKCV
jgi:hypothetical protein